MVERLIRRAGLSSEAFDIYTVFEGDLSKVWSDPSIKVVIGCGEPTLRCVIGETDIFRWQNRPIEHISGKIFIPAFLPSKLVHHRQPKGKRKARGILNPPRLQICFIYALHKALQIAKQGFKRTPGTYICDPHPGEFERFAEDIIARGCEFTFDIETAYKQKAMKEDELEEGEALSDSNKLITRISFSDRPYFGLTVPFSGPYLAIIRRLLESANPKNGWNFLSFDVEVLAHNGYAVNGTLYDYMDGWHLYMSDLPKDLEFTSGMTTDALPWKHLSSASPALYNAIDSDIQMRCATEIRQLLEQAGQWNLFKRHGVYLSPILKEAGKRGNCIDIEAQDALREELEQEYQRLADKAQVEVPFELYPRDKIVKTKLPANGTLASEGIPADRLFEQVSRKGKQKRCEQCGEIIANKSSHQKGKKNPCKGAKLIPFDAILPGYREILDFNPNSSDQMLAYMKHFDHEIGRPKDDEEGESADSKHLKKLVKRHGNKHPVYQTTLDLHLVTKALGTYVNGWKPDASGRIHTTYVNSPSTWRLGSRAINVQNAGKRSTNPWAKRARSTLIASPGHLLVQADSSSIEAVLVGYYMGDQDYITLAKRGIHAYVCSKKLGLPFSAEIGALIKAEHAALYDQVKMCVHGTNYGMGPHMLVETFPELYPSLKVARDTQALVFEVLPQLERWHHALRHTAQKEAYLETPWGYRHYFYDVFSMKPNGTIRYGKDSKRCIAFKPQNSAGAIARDNILIMGTTHTQRLSDPECYPAAESSLYGAMWRPYMPANLTVHDGYCLDVPEGMKMAAAKYLAKLLTRPIYELGGLRIGCEVEAGPNWSKMEKLLTVTTLEEELIAA